jgi:energy-coupling factor transporter ATP-binding protein EcfA2
MNNQRQKMVHTQYHNPFVGLRAFEESEDYLFFGRTKEIDDLLKKFSENRFLAVIGSSGSGKSSLVKSGMLPPIYGGFLKAEGNWRVALMQPGENPIGYLARQLAKEGVLYDHIENTELPYESIIESRLRRSENGLQHVYTDAHLPENENLLIVVDQFEELFRFNRYEKESKFGKSDAMHFIQILLTASQQQDYPIYVLLTMRSDFLGDCAEFRGLPEAINKGQYLVPRMTRDEIREAITGPVAVSNATISPRLVTRLLNDINNDTDQLPILQHALMRTWDVWHKKGQYSRPIDFEDYEQTGTMATALSQHADEAYGELDSEREQKICELMFKALTDTSADVRGIRRPRSITDLCIITGASQKEIKRQVEVFRKPGRTFLMPPHGVELTDDTIIDISHESLMRVWQRLVHWTEEEARSGDLYRRLSSSAELKESGQRGLLKDPELSIALRWKQKNQPNDKWAEGFKADFQKTMNYLEESRVVDIEEKRVYAKKEASRKRMVKIIIVLLAMLMGLGFVLAAYWNQKKYEAEQDKRKAVEERDRAIKAENDALRSKIAANEALQQAKENKDVAEKNALKADSAALVAKAQKDSANIQKNNADQLKRQAIINTFKNAPSEYARLIREGPVNKKEIQAEDFDLKLSAYTQHLDILEPKIIEIGEPEAIDKFNKLKDRLYYNNDLYEKIYACMATVPDPDAKSKLFARNIRYNKGFNGDFDPSNPSFVQVNNEMKAMGKRINKIVEDKGDHRILCATDDNWIYVYRNAGNLLRLENRIPMGTLVTALDYNADKHIIYFGLRTGNIGYIKYNKDKKNQLVFENYMGSPVVSIQLFKNTVKGKEYNFLLATAEKSRVVVYKLDENSLQPDKNLFGNVLPEKKLGVLTNAQFDERMQAVVIRAQSQRTGNAIYYSWNPFTAVVLDEYKKWKSNESYLAKTSIYD